MNQYKRQVALLLQVLPEVAKESCFALHGGTAINLFVRQMPRLSIDIDLTYIPMEDRQSSLDNIADALIKIGARLERVIPKAQISFKLAISKLLISNQGVQVKVEVNRTNRGLLEDPVNMTLCDQAQEQFDAFCEVPVVPFAQLYGGKICAALDRQHPRDLFDIKLLLGNEGLTSAIKSGLILSLLSSNRPLHELLNPHLQDQRLAMSNQFEGMTTEEFAYEEYETIRLNLIHSVREILEDKDKQFLLNFCDQKPDWNIYDFERFPSIQWKLQNLQKLKSTNSEKHQEQLDTLESLFS